VREKYCWPVADKSSEQAGKKKKAQLDLAYGAQISVVIPPAASEK
jgi:hypothetical protein